jgi:hypothetical protein
MSSRNETKILRDLYNKSRMMGDYHVRFCERFRGEIPLYLLDTARCEASKAEYGVKIGFFREVFEN